MNKILPVVLLLLSFSCSAVVKRHDISPQAYELKDAPDFFIDMPHEGSAILIDKYWLLTAAHVIFYDYHNKPIMLHGVKNRIEKVIFHPGYQHDPGNWVQGDAKPLIDFLRSRNDIVLLKLAKPVEHLNPIERYTGNKEIGMEIKVYGKGATGTGLTGEKLETKEPGFWENIANSVKSIFSDLDETQHYKTLNHYRNIIESVDENWFTFRFDKNSALPLEGSVGSGDSGGPAIIIKDKTPILVGLASWQEFEGDLKDYIGGKYGAVSVFARISAYNTWIDETISSHTKAK